MKAFYLFSVLTLFSLVACSDSTPDCISEEITLFQSNQSDCPGASVIKYTFQNQTLYGFADGTCIADGGTRLLDESCNDYCFIGGFAAFIECQGENFAENAIVEEVIWEVK